MNVLARLGEILYGIAWMAALPMLAVMLHLWATAPGTQAEQSVLFIGAVVTLTAGRSLLYLWSGR